MMIQWVSTPLRRSLPPTFLKEKPGMRVYGIDFTSAPRRAKPIVCSVGSLEETELRIEAIVEWTTFDPFEQLLTSLGPWFAGVDLPLGQPAGLVEQLGWPRRWEDYVCLVASMSRAEFVSTLEAFSSAQPVGQKHLFRAADRQVGACSPMMIYGVPVAKMFYEGATRIAKSDVAVMPCRRNGDSRIVVETYPAVVARALVGRRRYKVSTRKQDSDLIKATRQQIVAQICTTEFTERFDLSLRLTNSMRRQLETDHTGDSLDAVLCCLLAAWCVRQGSGLWEAGEVAKDEGWIPDPFAKHDPKTP